MTSSNLTLFSDFFNSLFTKLLFLSSSNIILCLIKDILDSVLVILLLVNKVLYCRTYSSRDNVRKCSRSSLNQRVHKLICILLIKSITNIILFSLCILALLTTSLENFFSSLTDNISIKRSNNSSFSHIL